MNDSAFNTMPELADANILYLDDQEENLSDTKKMFLLQGISIDVSESIDNAKSKALENQTDLLLCDLRLDDIKEGERGDRVLRFIRNRKKGIFLGLYTAYINDLSPTERKRLTQNQIYVYDKSDHDLFVMNLELDYKNFRQQNPFSEDSTDAIVGAEIFVVIKQLVLKHLGNISNQDITVPIPGENDIPVRDLIHEVSDVTEIGKKYIKGWIDTVATIQTVRKK